MALQGAISLVTGGASGLGRATVQRFIKKGSKVILCDLPTSKGQEVADELGPDCTFAPCDITSVSDVKSAVELCREKHNKLDVVVNCAGMIYAAKCFNFNESKPHSLEKFNEMLITNVGGTFNVVTQCLSLMNEKPEEGLETRGVIINTSSISAFDGQIGQCAYAASKAAIAGMTLPLARDLSNRGIRVVTIAPGVFMTPMMEQLPEKVQTAMAFTVPFPKRFGDPSEFAHLCQAIVANPMLNGETIRLDGALRMMP